MRICFKHCCTVTNVFFFRDTLFKEDFSLGKFTERFLEVQNKDKESNLVLSYQCKDEGK